MRWVDDKFKDSLGGRKKDIGRMRERVKDGRKGGNGRKKAKRGRRTRRNGKAIGKGKRGDTIVSKTKP